MQLNIGMVLFSAVETITD